MAIDITRSSLNLSKVKIGESIYHIKDAELQAALNTAAQKAAATLIDASNKSSNDAVPTIKAITDYINGEMEGLTSAMHFAGVTDPTDGDTFADRVAALYAKEGHDPLRAGDIVIDGTTEYVYDGSAWKELGDEDNYVSKSQLETALQNLSVADVALGTDKAITAAELKEALGLGALAYKNDAAGSVTVPKAAQTLSGLAKAGEYIVSGDAVAVPATYDALDVTPAGSVELTAGTAAAASYDKAVSGSASVIGSVQYDKVNSNVAITAAAPQEGETANYTPAGSVSLPSFSGSVTLASTDVATVTNAGTAYALSGGSVSKADDAKAAFASEGVTAHMASGAEISGDTDAETLIFAAAATAQAVTAAGDVTYTAPTLTGSLPTFGTQAVATAGNKDVTVTAGGDASFTGTAVFMKGAATTSKVDADTAPTTVAVTITNEPANATMTQPTFSAAFSGTQKTVTPTVATTAQAAPANAKITVASENKEIALETESKTVTVS